MNARRLTLAIFVTMLGAMAVAAAPVLAAEKYVFSVQFEGLNSNGDPLLSEPTGVAIDESTGHVFVVNSGGNPHQVDNYEASGALDATTPQLTGRTFGYPYGVAVDNSGLASKGDIYVSDFEDGAIDQFDPAGAATAVRITEANIPAIDQGNGTFEPIGVAVNSSGELFVADFSNGVVDEFSSGGAFVAQIGSAAEIDRPQLLAIDSAGNLYVASEEGVVEFNSSGSCVDSCVPIDAAGHRGVAVDDAGDVFVGEETRVSEYNASRVLTGRFGSHSDLPAFGGLDSAFGLAVNNTTHEIYVVDNLADVVDVFSSAVVPDVSTGSSSSTAPGEFTLSGTVNPGGMAVVSCEFEYGSSTAYGQSVPCVPEAKAIPVDSSEHAVSANVAGLAPGEYHYRLGAGNANGENQGEDGTFSVAYKPVIESWSSSSVGASAAMVSARVDPGGALTTYYVEYGTSVSYGSSTPRESVGAGGEGAAVQVEVGGLQPETTYHARVVSSNALGTEYGGDFSFTTLAAPSAVTLSFGLPDGRGYEMVSPLANANGNVYEPVSPFNSDNGEGENTAEPMRAAADGSAVEYVADPPVTGGTGNTGFGHGNEYVATHEPGGGWSAVDLETPGFDIGPYQALFPTELSNAGTSAVPAGSHTLDTGAGGEDLYDSVGGRSIPVNALPDGTLTSNAEFGDKGDLSHVIAADGSRIFWTDLSTGVLYVREDDATTIPVSGGAGEFWTATPDGRDVFYTEGGKLWRFDIEGQERQELAGAGAEVQGVVGTSEDGEYAYFVARGVLAGGATLGGDNLYLRDHGATKFIATLAENDNFVDALGFEQGDWQARLGLRAAEVTPNGHSVVFVSEVSLTGYDSERHQEAYVYDAETSRISCVSCNPSGARATGYAILPHSWSNAFMHRWITDDGTRVFFNTPEALVPQDTDGTADVYEWEQDGTGSCGHAGGYNDGCIYLLSGGTSTDNSFLLDASASGDDVFIITRAQLVAEDQNESLDVYDVRVGASQALTAPECSGSGCQGVPAVPPIFATPASATFNGVGNFPVPESAPVKAKTPTGSQKLAKALKVCRAKRDKHARAGCEARARKRYEPGRKAKKSDRGGGK